MTLYYGVVKGNRVELEEGAQLADGTAVEVRPHGDGVSGGAAMIGETAATHGGQAKPAAEDVFKQRLRSEGRLAPAVTPVVRTARPLRLINVQGQPLSEQIIAERR